MRHIGRPDGTKISGTSSPSAFRLAMASALDFQSRSLHKRVCTEMIRDVIRCVRRLRIELCLEEWFECTSMETIIGANAGLANASPTQPLLVEVSSKPLYNTIWRRRGTQQGAVQSGVPCARGGRHLSFVACPWTLDGPWKG